MPLATAVNRLGARLVGIATSLSGRIAFSLAGLIGALSGILIAPLTTIYYDSGFLIGLKGFVAAIIGGMVSYPLAAAAAIVVGLVESFSSFYASAFKEVSGRAPRCWITSAAASAPSCAAVR